MKIIKSRFLRTCLAKWRKTEFRAPITSSSSSSSSSSLACESCCQWAFLARSTCKKQSFIPWDVPEGHVPVYVGESYKRFVIKIALLDHPLFQALLDLARDEYGFSSGSKLCIPCDENMFVEVVRCAGYPKDRSVFLCF